MSDYTLVVFRRWKNGDVIALFPYLPGAPDATTCQSYEHIGQHGAATPHLVIAATRPAKESEYADLKKELHSIGYDLDIATRIPRDAMQRRADTLHSLR